MAKHHTFCRLCLNGCAMIVDVENGQAVRLEGDKDNPVYRGFTCVKGREQGRLLQDERRLRHSLKRQPDGSFKPIPVADAIGEIAQRLSVLIAEHGPDAFAGYLGTAFATSAATMPLFGAFMGAIKSAMVFSPATIDKPGRKIAQALHGSWCAPAVEFDDPEVILLVGANPLITFTGFPYGNPGKWLNERIESGAKLIVIDPRRSDVARRAHLHIAPRAGEDVAIAAAILRVVLEEGRYDKDFAGQHCTGLDALMPALEPFTPDSVAKRADIDAEDLVAAARLMGSTRRGYIMAGTGPNMSGYGTLAEYLLINLHTLCGYWLRDGDRVRHPGALVTTIRPRAQVAPHAPAYGFGVDLGVRNLAMTAGGLPTAALPDLMLGKGKNRVRAMISCGGNPVAAWPDQRKTIDAMKALKLLVQIDPWMSATARMADYVIAPKIWLEVPGTTQVLDWLTRYGTGYGQADPYAQYSPALVDPPEGSDLIEEWEFYYDLARAMGLPLAISPGIGPDMPPLPLDMARKPSTDDVLATLCTGSRVPLETVKAQVSGAIYEGAPVHVAPAEPDASERFRLADPDMLKDLADYAARGPDPESRKFRLLCRRMMHVYNSAFVGALPASARQYNPVFLHPDDMTSLGLNDGDVVDIVSAEASIPGIAHADDKLRRSTVSMSFGFGALPDDEDAFRSIGSNTTLLLSNDKVFDRYSGQPLMTNIPVDIRPRISL